MVAVVKKQKFHHVTPLRETGPVCRSTQVQLKVLTCNGGFSHLHSVKKCCDTAEMLTIIFFLSILAN